MLEFVGQACLLSLSLTNNDSQCKDFAWLGSYFSLGDKMIVIPCTHDIWAADSRVWQAGKRCHCITQETAQGQWLLQYIGQCYQDCGPGNSGFD